ncbi:response regulator [bacterium]|nr:MAG: response regulator [bacterium]
MSNAACREITTQKRDSPGRRRLLHAQTSRSTIGRDRGQGMNLFDFARVSSFPSKTLDDLKEGDPLWSHHIAKRRSALFAENDRTSLDWLLRSAEYFVDTATYTEASIQASRARALMTEDSDARIVARALRVQCVCELMLGEFQKARSHVDQLDKLAKEAEIDDYVDATLCFLEGLYLMHADMEALDGPLRAIQYLEDSIALFEACEEPDLSIRSRIELANAHAWNGEYITAIRTIQTAMDQVEGEEAWSHAGRLLQVTSSAAIDQGYRAMVAETLQRSLEWCLFSGDAWGRVHALYALGRMYAYQMPAGDPSLAAVPEKHYRDALAEAEHLGMVRLAARVKISLATLYEKCGDDSRSREIVDQSLQVQNGPEPHFENALTSANRVFKNIERRISSRLQDGIEDSPDAFFVFDARRDGENRYVDYINEYRNEAGAKLMRIAPGSVLMFSEIQVHPCLEGLAKPLADAVERRITHQDICEHVENEESFWFRRRIVPSGDGAVLTLRDVTAEHHIEEALRRAAYSAERADRAKSEFLANMSHEIRTPINGVLGLARLLDDTGLAPIQKSYVDDIIGSGDLLLNVIGDILDLSKIESDGMPIDRRPVDIGHLVAGITRLYQGQAKEKGLGLQITLAPSTPKTVLADGPRIRQIVSNLVGNALKFTQKGSVTVCVEGADHGVTIEVSDTGIGIPTDRLEAIFDRFQQATAESRMYGGTGLGLTLCKGIVELMDGTIEVESKLGVGSNFIVRLPLSVTDQIAVQRKGDLPADFKGRRILVVDDNRVNTVVSKYALEKLGCTVDLAGNGLEALDAWERGGIDLILMDIRMPLLDGLEATRTLREKEALRGDRIPVVALTAGALLEERNECFEAGMDDYISKPFAGESLREVLARWLL